MNYHFNQIFQIVQTDMPFVALVEVECVVVNEGYYKKIFQETKNYNNMEKMEIKA